ncbi:hypothetical protein [Limisalsivibrio acetivorans]|uniref:hypothetical protein n=1 Tax=Limisalsivibrio acetivorans TaxID=1304888 RepID=UPI0003B61860|nr:hypothetical protein [Limisalsivibrio acetivorans]
MDMRIPPLNSTPDSLQENRKPEKTDEASGFDELLSMAVGDKDILRDLAGQTSRMFLEQAEAWNRYEELETGDMDGFSFGDGDELSMEEEMDRAAEQVLSGGYFSVEETSDRLMDLIEDLSPSGSENQRLIAALSEGLRLSEESGESIPEAVYDTYEHLMDRLNRA